MRTVKLIILGLVQGVFFRAFIQEQADKIGLKGYVRNLEGGEIEVIIEGDDTKVGEMIEICKKGAPHSQVKDVQIEEREHQGFEGFKVLRI